MGNLLAIQDVRIRFALREGGAVEALRGVSFQLGDGEILGILGESGCGKTTMAKAIAGVLPKNAEILGGSMLLAGNEIRFSKNQAHGVHGRTVLISQEPGIALNPVLRVGDQIAEVFRARNRWDKARCRQSAEELLHSVQLGEDPKLYDAYPHQISGGQQQRIVIAQALACKPDVLIADEPTASLDASTKAGIVDLLKNAVAQRSMALVVITHDPLILAGLAQRVLVMYGGRIVEEGAVKDVFHKPLHPYTRALLSCMKTELSREETIQGSRFPTLAGSSTALKPLQSGCSFAARCKERAEQCNENSPSKIRLGETQSVECLLYAD
jgi:peptide/nickel transport system ATP-binding protein